MSLAQHYLDVEPKAKAERLLKLDFDIAAGRCRPELKQLWEWAHDTVVESLKIPLSIDTKNDKIAERFVFHVDVPMLIQQMIRTNQLDPGVIMETARMPADRVWLEFPMTYEDDTSGRFGALLFRTEQNLYRVIMVASTENGAVGVIGAATFCVAPPWRRDADFMAHWYCDHLAGEFTEHDTNTLKSIILEVIDCLFLLTIPRVAELRTTTWAPKKQRARERAGKPPLVELRHVELKIGVGTPRYSRPGTGEATTTATPRRLHKVLGHLRVYRKDRETPHVAFVPNHWRGDPKLGMIVHEREIKE